MSSRPAWSTGQVPGQPGSEGYTGKPVLKERERERERESRVWWRTPLIPALRRQRQVDF